VAFGEQNTRDRKQRIEMARRRRRSDKNFHDIGPLIVDKARYVGFPHGRDAFRRKSPPGTKPRERPARWARSATGEFQGLDIALRL
jgi:hypothetical protein